MNEKINEVTNKLKKKYPDLAVYQEGDKLYTKDNLTSCIYRFVNFVDAYSDGIFDTLGDSGSLLNPGIFKKNPKGWNIQAACNWLHSHSSATSQHACARYVRMAIEAGGLSTEGRPRWAWKYVDYLPNIGFKFIGKVHRSKMGSFRAEPGDIAVYQKGGNPAVPGHICMWTGVAWESDFKQNNMIVYSSTQEACLFRFQS